ncbi:hypothetical protein E2562_039127 [Oryza meyeriana var. granulata]|uniref:Uncharacterized protein n=1 Tax=Oryza meyeriana var. granulata TaxID=110450 RepID=A0A6G1DTT8_9ORYZ|nr:hypothetical protein E2562_039127 [Oryza meyeriana var. granulata]
MAKGLSAVPARKDEDESLVLFGELYKHEKEKDMNLLEPMYSVEFEAIQVPATKNTASKAANKTSASKKPEVPGSTNAVKKMAKPGIPNKPLKKTAATAPKAQSNDPAICMKNVKVDLGTTRRLSCPPAATMRSNNELDTVAAKGRRRTGGESVAGNGARATEATTRGRRRADADKGYGQRLGSHAKK